MNFKINEAYYYLESDVFNYHFHDVIKGGAMFTCRVNNSPDGEIDLVEFFGSSAVEAMMKAYIYLVGSVQ